MANSITDFDQTQWHLMEEMCILVNEKDEAIGKETKKNSHLKSNIEKGLLHRAFSVFLFNSKNELLLQQRASAKITFPSYWTNTCCSHPLYFSDEMEPDIGVKRAAQRKLEHELGITKEDTPLDGFYFMTRLHYKAMSDGVWGEHEVDHILIMKRDIKLNPNPNEVDATRYVSKLQLKELFAQAETDKELKLTPWFKLIVEKFLYSWWDSLDNLDALLSQRDSKIHYLH